RPRGHPVRWRHGPHRHEPGMAARPERPRSRWRVVLRHSMRPLRPSLLTAGHNGGSAMSDRSPDCGGGCTMHELHANAARVLDELVDLARGVAVDRITGGGASTGRPTVVELTTYICWGLLDDPRYQ